MKLKYDPQYVFSTDLPQLKNKKIEILDNATTTLNKYLVDNSTSTNEILFSNSKRESNKEKQEIKSRLRLLAIPPSRKDVLYIRSLFIIIFFYF